MEREWASSRCKADQSGSPGLGCTAHPQSACHCHKNIAIRPWPWPLALTLVRGRRNWPHHPASVPLAAMCVFRPDAFGFGVGFGVGLHAFGFALALGLRVGPVPTFPRAPIAGHDAVDNRVDPDVGARWRAKGA
jgi:hypothetical protein